MTTLDTQLPAAAARTPTTEHPGDGHRRRHSARGRSGSECSGRTPLSPNRFRVVVIVLAAVMAAGCTVSTGAERGRQERVTATEAAKNGTAELRTDLGPLRDRFPILGEHAAARWMSGTRGDSDIPGPSTYWIDAVITLPPPETDKLMSAYSPTVTGLTPTVVDGMREHLPAGPFLTGEAFDAAFRHDRWSAAAYLHTQTNTLVLVATGT